MTAFPRTPIHPQRPRDERPADSRAAVADAARRRVRRLAGPARVAFAFLLVGCVTTSEGTPLTLERVAAVQRGVTRDEVQRVLGEPIERMRAPNGAETWRYEQVFRRDSPLVSLCWLPPFAQLVCRPTERRESLVVAFDAQRRVSAVERRVDQGPLLLRSEPPQR